MGDRGCGEGRGSGEGMALLLLLWFQPICSYFKLASYPVSTASFFFACWKKRLFFQHAQKKAGSRD